eukprot:750623-Rhodomonas_salina.1
MIGEDHDKGLARTRLLAARWVRLCARSSANPRAVVVCCLRSSSSSASLRFKTASNSSILPGESTIQEGTFLMTGASWVPAIASIGLS